MQRLTTRRLVFSAAVAALYTALTLIFAFSSFGPVQFRVSEALTVLPFFFPHTTLGLFTGCLLANLLGGAPLLDVIFGPLATLIAGFLTSKMKKKWQAPLPPILINAVIVGLILAATQTGATLAAFPLFAFEVGLGQTFAIYGLGLPLLYTIERLGLDRRFSL